MWMIWLHPVPLCSDLSDLGSGVRMGILFPWPSKCGPRHSLRLKSSALQVFVLPALPQHMLLPKNRTSHYLSLLFADFLKDRSYSLHKSFSLMSHYNLPFFEQYKKLLHCHRLLHFLDNSHPYRSEILLQKALLLFPHLSFWSWSLHYLGWFLTLLHSFSLFQYLAVYDEIRTKPDENPVSSFSHISSLYNSRSFLLDPDHWSFYRTFLHLSANNPCPHFFLPDKRYFAYSLHVHMPRCMPDTMTDLLYSCRLTWNTSLMLLQFPFFHKLLHWSSCILRYLQNTWSFQSLSKTLCVRQLSYSTDLLMQDDQSLRSYYLIMPGSSPVWLLLWKPWRLYSSGTVILLNHSDTLSWSSGG